MDIDLTTTEMLCSREMTRRASFAEKETRYAVIGAIAFIAYFTGLASVLLAFGVKLIG
jgi:hypothetical protein